jgi:hypothetical protein
MPGMRARFVLLCALVIAPTLSAQAAASTDAVATKSPPPASPLDAFRWKKRVLLILTPSLEDARSMRQTAALAGALPEITARGIEVIVALPGDARRARLPLRTEDFMIALIGLDGGLKLSRRDLLTPEALIREVDSMPLRRSEQKSAERAGQKGDPRWRDPR